MNRILLVMLLVSQFTFSQKGLYGTIDGYLPSIDINKSRTISQQLTAGIGYGFTENVGAKLNVGAGLLGNNSIPTFGTTVYSSFGLSANYWFLSLKNNQKLGLEALCDYNLDLTNKSNYNHLSATGALLFGFTSKCYLKLGVQNRFMPNNDALSLVVGFGFVY